MADISVFGLKAFVRVLKLNMDTEDAQSMTQQVCG